MYSIFDSELLFVGDAGPTGASRPDCVAVWEVVCSPVGDLPHSTAGNVEERGAHQRRRPALAYMEKIMSNTQRTESREVSESGELTDDKIAVVVGGRPGAADLKLARDDFKKGDLAGAWAHLSAYFAGGGGGGYI